METLPKDVAIEMALNLSPPDLINFCAASKIQNRVCNSNDFWRRKIHKDYPETIGQVIENPKEFYIQKFTYVSRNLEKLQEMIIAKSFPFRFSKYLTNEYRKDMYFSLYLIYEMVKNKQKDKEGEYMYVVEQLDDLIPIETLMDYDLAAKILNSMHEIVSNQ